MTPSEELVEIGRERIRWLIVETGLIATRPEDRPDSHTGDMAKVASVYAMLDDREAQLAATQPAPPVSDPTLVERIDPEASAVASQTIVVVFPPPKSSRRAFVSPWLHLAAVLTTAVYQTMRRTI